MKLYEPYWIDAVHRSFGNHACPCQVLSGVKHAAQVLTSSIKRVRMDVESTAARVGEDEVALPRIGPRLLIKSASCHQTTQQRYLRVRYGDVQITVVSSPLSQQSVYRPTASTYTSSPLSSRNSSNSMTSGASTGSPSLTPCSAVVFVLLRTSQQAEMAYRTNMLSLLLANKGGP
jgi:hypothetical protein